jgi:triosephosphate isomerase (TIM)
MGNWKMNGSRASVEGIVNGFLREAKGVTGVDVVICPPYLHIPYIAGRLAPSIIHWGGQDISEQPFGPYTGEISAEMLAEFGCQYVIVGHSERRHRHKETNVHVAQKFAAAQRGGLVPVLCVGETAVQREGGRAKRVVGEQLDAVIDGVGIEALGRAVVAYEPVWAVGTGTSATPEQAQAMHAYIREKISARSATIARSLRIIYGGSVTEANAEAIFSEDDVDGGLIGGASLRPKEFLAICLAAAATIR